MARRLFRFQEVEAIERCASSFKSPLSVQGARDLFEFGFTVIDEFYGGSVLVQDAAKFSLELANTPGELTKASMVRKDDDEFRDRSARDDMIAW